LTRVCRGFDIADSAEFRSGFNVWTRRHAAGGCRIRLDYTDNLLLLARGVGHASTKQTTRGVRANGRKKITFLSATFNSISASLSFHLHDAPEIAG